MNSNQIENNSNLDKLKNKAAEKVNELSASVESGKKKAEKILQQTSTDLEKHISELQESIKNFTEKNPWKAVGISLVAGMLIAGLMRK